MDFDLDGLWPFVEYVDGYIISVDVSRLLYTLRLN